MANRQIAGLTTRVLTLTDVIPTQDATAVAEAGKNTMIEVRTLVNGRLVYCFDITQSGSADPTLNTYLNQLSGAVVWTRLSTGTYMGTLVGAFLVGKIPKVEGFIKFGSNLGSTILNTFTIQRLSDDTIALGTFTNGTLTDGLLSSQYFELSIFY